MNYPILLLQNERTHFQFRVQILNQSVIPKLSDLQNNLCNQSVDRLKKKRKENEIFSFLLGNPVVFTFHHNPDNYFTKQIHGTTNEIHHATIH